MEIVTSKNIENLVNESNDSNVIGYVIAVGQDMYLNFDGKLVTEVKRARIYASKKSASHTLAAYRASEFGGRLESVTTNDLR